MRARFIRWTGVAILAITCIAWLACGNKSATLSTGLPATVAVSISDPPTCAAPAGQFTHVYVTISDVLIHTSSTAAPTDSGWVSLTPNLSTAPKQVDLLGLTGNGCLLAQLGSNTNVPPGTYQQIRLMLSSNAAVANNQCGSSANCVVTTSGTSALTLSSETQTGIKIPSGQIAGGAFVVADGENKSLTIDFDACASLVTLGNNGYRLKPAMSAGETGLTSNAITGQLVDSVTRAAISNARTIIALEQKDATGIYRVVRQATPDSAGNFNICPVPAGTYELVAVALINSGASAGQAYATTIVSAVQPGAAIGAIPMTAQTGVGATQQATITGQVTTAGASGAVATDATLSALQPVTVGTATSTYTIPLAAQSASLLNFTTATGAGCAANTACVTYTVGVPAVLPFVGTFATSGTTFSQSTGTSVNYTMDVQTFAAGGGGTPTCSPSEVKVTTNSANAALTVTAGQTTTAATATFTGCQ